MPLILIGKGSEKRKKNQSNLAESFRLNKFSRGNRKAAPLWDGFSEFQRETLLITHDRLFGLLCRFRLFGSGVQQRIQGDEVVFWLFAKNMLAVEFRHLSILSILFQLAVSCANFFFACVLGNPQLIQGVISCCVNVLIV